MVVNACIRGRNNHTVFDLIGAGGAYVNLFSTTRAKDRQVGDNK